MKKLMIVAAIAAMAGGAIADTNTAYTFTATLKTTKGKSGKVTTTYNLGADATGEFWYSNRVVSALITADTNNMYFTDKKVGGRPVKALTAEAKKNADWLLNTLRIESLATTYNKKSAGKWCDTVKVTKEGCYRVAGTEKIKAIVGGGCCGDPAFKTLTDEDGELMGDDISIGMALVNRFGGLSYKTAKKAEIFATVNTDQLYLAGQGSIGKTTVAFLDDANEVVVKSKEDGITSLSGNIVGFLPAPACEYCCSAPDPAIAFVCGDENDNEALDTAAYGTFSLKYNAKVTKSNAEELTNL